MCPLYVAGLIGPGERKSIEPMAARMAPDRLSGHRRYEPAQERRAFGRRRAAICVRARQESQPPDTVRDEHRLAPRGLDRHEAHG